MASTKSPQHAEIQHFLTEAQAAGILGLEPATLRQWRFLGRGPAYHKFGSAVRYDPREIERFIAGSRRSSETGDSEGRAFSDAD